MDEESSAGKTALLKWLRSEVHADGDHRASF